MSLAIRIPLPFLNIQCLETVNVGELVDAEVHVTASKWGSPEEPGHGKGPGRTREK